MALNSLNAEADVVDKSQALAINITAAKSLAGLLKTNLGPAGTMKLLVSGAGDLTLTKDGNVLLNQMQIQHPTAALIARAATAQDDIFGDGTTSNVLMTGELLKQAERYIGEGLHPRVLVEGIELARDEALKFVDTIARPFDDEKLPETERKSVLLDAARSALRTKVSQDIADHLAPIIVDAVLAIRRPGFPLDLHMVEIMTMKHKSALDSRFVKGLVLDHGSRHVGMSKSVKNSYVLLLNVSLEYEKTEVNSGFFYSTAEERERMVKAERAFTNEKVEKIIAFKNKVCPEGSGKGLVLINYKGIDPISLDLLQRANIVALRRAKRRNMERIPLAFGGFCVNSVEDLTPECLGNVDEVYEHVLDQDKYTFMEGAKDPKSVTILLKGAFDHTIKQLKDAVRDGLRAIKNIMDDRCYLPGAGAFEVATHLHLSQIFKPTISGRKKLGVQAFADALLIIPKVLATNSGLDAQDAVLELLEAASKLTKEEKGAIGLDIITGKPIYAAKAGILDSVAVKKQLLQLATVTASKLLLVDEIIRAGRTPTSAPPEESAPPMD